MVKDLFWTVTIFVLIGFFPLAYANDNAQMGKAEKETESSQEKGPKVVTYYITIDDEDDRETFIITSTATGTGDGVISYYKVGEIVSYYITIHDDGETFTVTGTIPGITWARSGVHSSDFNPDEDRESADKTSASRPNLVLVIVISGVGTLILVLLIQFILIKVKERYNSGNSGHHT